jgi:uncharacterized membrane protein YeaQ/YmgE (transglycosylase-associated protein family)
LRILVLLVISFVVRFVSMRLVPLALPSSRIQTLGLGFMGALGGSLVGNAFWPVPINLVGIHFPMALLGAILAIFILGLLPFLRIMAGRP